MAGYRYRDNGVKSEMLRLKINRALEESEQQGNIRLTKKDRASGDTKPTVAGALIQLLDALRDSNSQGTTDPTSLLATTTQGTYIVFVIDATTVGMRPTTRSMIGQVRELLHTLHGLKLPMNGSKQS